jgi:WD40 repeat protein
LKIWEVPTGRLLKTLEGHEGCVTSVAISEDGALGLSGDATLKLWDLQNGDLLQTLKRHGSVVTSVALSSDGRLALSAWLEEDRYDPFDPDCRDSHVWLEVQDLSADGRCRRLDGHQARVSSLALSADGTLALSGSWDGVRLWNTSSGRLLRVFEGHETQVTSVAMTADARLALSGYSDGTLRLWNASSGRLLRVFEGHENEVTSVAMSADGWMAISASEDKTVKLWDVSALGASQAKSASFMVSFEGEASMTAVAIDRLARWAFAGDLLGRIHSFAIRV